MKIKKTKKKIKFYLAISFIISLVIMLRVAITKGNLMCGLYYKPAPCPILPWVIQVIVFTIGIAIILALLIAAVKAILKYIPEIKKIKKHKPKEVKKEATKKEAKVVVKEKEEKPKKKEEVIKI
ncbi:hypothetical protein KY331_02480 [Candidatus Woesearchaeota archaeon]|nr:hypothetical protein [Candidatus Woesearchaeota archaeon]